MLLKSAEAVTAAAIMATIKEKDMGFFSGLKVTEPTFTEENAK
jgi:hypothetical protein